LIEGRDWHLMGVSLPQRTPNEILDLGGRTGTRALLMLELGFEHARGYDISPERVSEAAELASKRNLPARLAVADVNSPELKKNRFDLVTSCHSYYHLLERILVGIMVGTVQLLLCAGIVHNFREGDPEARRIINSIDNLESVLIAGQ